MKLDLRAFNRNLRAIASSVKRNAAAELNRALKTVGERVAAAIPPVAPSRIRRDLTRDTHILAALTSKRLAKKGIGILPSPNFRRAMNAFLRFKMASSGYMSSPWAQISDRRSKRFLGIHVLKTLASPSKLKCEVSFTMSHETGEKRKTAKARFVRELQPILDSVMAGIDAREVLKGWRS